MCLITSTVLTSFRNASLSATGSGNLISKGVGDGYFEDMSGRWRQNANRGQRVLFWRTCNGSKKWGFLKTSHSILLLFNKSRVFFPLWIYYPQAFQSFVLKSIQSTPMFNSFRISQRTSSPTIKITSDNPTIRTNSITRLCHYIMCSIFQVCC